MDTPASPGTAVLKILVSRHAEFLRHEGGVHLSHDAHWVPSSHAISAATAIGFVRRFAKHSPRLA